MQKTAERKTATPQPVSAAHRYDAPAQGYGPRVEPPDGGRLAQLVQLAKNSSPDGGRLAQLAQLIEKSPRLQAQRDLITSIHNSPYMVAQRKEFDSLFGPSIQRKGIDEEEPLQAVANTEELEELDGAQRKRKSRCNTSLRLTPRHCNGLKKPPRARTIPACLTI